MKVRHPKRKFPGKRATFCPFCGQSDIMQGYYAPDGYVCLSCGRGFQEMDVG